MGLHLDRELESLKRKLFSLTTSVEERVASAVRAVEERDDALARTVMEGDDEIDATEVEIEEDCLKLLALHQPVASDLRYLVAVLKMNNDLERIGDLAVNTAHRAVTVCAVPRTKGTFDFREMSDAVRGMLRESLGALINLDTAAALRVCRSDAAVDDRHRRNLGLIRDAMRSDPSDIEALVAFVGVSRNLERIADHATNIAEDVVYCVDGTIIRHRSRV